MDRTDYEEHADEAVRGLIDTKKPLEDSIVEIAKRDSLNPEQIKRIIEMANTGAFLEMFKNTSGDDRMVEFPTANPDSVLKKFYALGDSAGGSAVSDTDSSSDGSFFDDISNENDDPNDLDEGTESSDSSDPLDRSSKEASWEPRVKFANAQKLAVRVDRAREVLKDKIAAEYYAAEDLAVKLSRKFASVYDRPKLAAFEADGLALYGPRSVVAFNAVRESLREPTYSRIPDALQVKVAAEFHLANSNTEEMKLLGDFLAKVSSLQKFQHAKRALEVEHGL